MNLTEEKAKVRTMRHWIALQIYKFGYWISVAALKLDGIDKASFDAFWFEEMKRVEEKAGMK